MDFSQRVQPPSLIQAPLGLSLPAQLTDAGFFNKGTLTWALENGDLFITDSTSGARVQTWRPSKAGYEITAVSELKTNTESLLAVALKSNGNNLIGVLSRNFNKLIRAVAVPNTITALHPFNFEGFSREKYSHPELFPNSVLSLFNGIVTVGTVGGVVYLIDLQLGSGEFDCVRDFLNSPSPMRVIQGPVSGRELAVMSQTAHVTIEINKGNFQRGKLLYPGPNRLPSQVLVSALYYAPQISCLFIGYSFGGFQVYELSTLQLIHSCPLPALRPPVTHFCYVEPENDPRKFVYIWVTRGVSKFVPSSSGAVISLCQLVFSSKSPLSTGQTMYKDFQGCGLRFEQTLNSEPGSDNFQDCPAARVVSCSTLLRYRREHPGNAPELDLSLAAFVWTVGTQQNPKVFVGLFDVNQWYHSQMPHSIRWKTKNRLSGVFGCSYFAFYDLSQAVTSIHIMDALIEGATPFHSELPMPEIFMWPSAVKFTLKMLTQNSVNSCECFGAQRMVLAGIDDCRGSLYAQPEKLFQLCVRTELLSHDMSHGSDLTSQRCALLGVALSHPLPTRVLTVFADSWAGAGMDQTVISRWIQLTKSQLDHSMATICGKLGDDGSPVAQVSHWRKISGIQLFLERLLTRGLEKEPRVYNAVSQLLLSVVKHKKVFEVVRFFNEQGLSANYPAAVLKRRYEKLRDSEPRLCIDCIIEDHHGNASYPPDSMYGFMSHLSTVEPFLLHCLVLYLLCDLDSLEGPSLAHHTQYASHQELPLGLVKTIEALWIMDNLKFKDPAYSVPARVLFTKRTSKPLFPWQHGMIIEKLLRYGEFKIALTYVGIHGNQMTGLEEVKLKLHVFVSNSLVDRAFKTLAQFEGSENYNELFTYFLDSCVECKTLHLLMDLPFSKQAEMTFVLYLESHPTLACQEFLVFYFLLRSRFVEAMAAQENIRKIVKSDPDPRAMDRCEQRDTLLAGLGAVVPKALHHVKMGGASRGGGSKVRVPVDKSLSAVVAKAVRAGDVAGHGGDVYSLIQSIAAERAVPSYEVTPLRPAKGSVTQLSHTPFLSTPISVKKVRAPLTASRVAPIMTPTPCPQRCHMMPGSHTSQRFASQIQGYKDHMASIFSQSAHRMDTSAIQTPSPVAAAGLIRSATPTSIMKGKRPPSQLTESRKIRFEDSPLTPQAKPTSRPVFTPAVPSSLSTTTSVAMVTPLPSSDDEDLFESPVESPSQLHTPFDTPPTATPHIATPKLSTQLMFNEADSPNAGATDIRDFGDITDAGHDIRDSGDDIHDITDAGRDIRDPSDIVDAGVQDDQFIAAADDEIMGEDGPVKQETSPLSSLKLTRDSLSSSVHSTSAESLQETAESAITSPPSQSFSLSILSSRQPLSAGSSLLSSAPSSTRPSILARETTSIRKTFTSTELPSGKTSIGPYMFPSAPLTGSSLFSSPFSPIHQDHPSKEPSRFKPTVSKPRAAYHTPSAPEAPVHQLFSPVPFLSDLSKPKQEKPQSSLVEAKTKPTAKRIFTSMAPSVSATAFNFTPPTKVSVTASKPVDSETEPMSFVFSPPLTRSAARRKREDSVVREDSLEPDPPVEVKKRPRGRPRKTPQPSSPPDGTNTLVTPPTMARPARDTRQKAKAKPVKTGVGSRRSARLLGSKK